MTARRVFHIVDPKSWLPFLLGEAEEWSPPSLEAEGFVHFSFAHQLPETLERHMADLEEAILAEIGSDTEGLVLEQSRDDEEFPHLYRAVRRSDFLRSWAIGKVDGTWKIPDLGSQAEEDQPPGLTFV